jgi:pimeloyl-ACP methyl ester carboxylesterase
VILNAPHPLVFQRSLIEDEAQREASQYIPRLRTPGSETAIKAMGLENFLEKVLGGEGDLRKLPENERQAYLQEWSEPDALESMINWYRAMSIEVPEPGEKARLPIWTHLPFPKVKVPTLVIWAMKDKALLPIQLGGLHDLVEDLRIFTIPDARHFVTWEKPEAVTLAIRDFIADTPLD